MSRVVQMAGGREKLAELARAVAVQVGDPAGMNASVRDMTKPTGPQTAVEAWISGAPLPLPRPTS